MIDHHHFWQLVRIQALIKEHFVPYFKLVWVFKSLTIQVKGQEVHLLCLLHAHAYPSFVNRLKAFTCRKYVGLFALTVREKQYKERKKTETYPGFEP